MPIRECEPRDREDWLRLRMALWPGTREDHAREIEGYFSGACRFVDQTFLHETEDGQIVGFVELRLRDYAEGSLAPKVPYLEGWYVEDAWQGRGIGRALIARSERWAKELGFSEIASDTDLDNTGSIAAHRALGFEVAARMISYLKKL